MSIAVSSVKSGRSLHYIPYFDRVALLYNAPSNGCSNTLCYTYSKNFIYKPHSAYGMVGTTAAAYLHRRKRL